jgi:DNA-binding MarR family transcriptional regulator
MRDGVDECDNFITALKGEEGLLDEKQVAENNKLSRIYGVAAEAVQEFHLIFRLLYNYYQHFASFFGITGSQLAALEKIYLEDGLTIGELSERMGLSASSVTGLVDRLERDKLVDRRRSSEDRRVVQVFLAPRGKEICDGKYESGYSFAAFIANKLSASLDANDIDRLVYLIRALRITLADDRKERP